MTYKVYIYISNWSSCKKLALSLIAHSVRASAQNSVVVGSNPTQGNYFL